MKTWQYSCPMNKLEDSLTVNEQTPVPKSTSLGKDDMLIEVINASINPVDYKLPESGIIGRIMTPRVATPGLDFCGRIIAKHPYVTKFEQGQLVFGGLESHNGLGTLAQYTVVSTSCCALLPLGIDRGDGAAVGTAATTAYQSLMPDTLPPAATIFINGGSGGVGTWTVQLVKTMGAKVVTSCSTKNLELFRSLGANEVVDYTKSDIVSFLKTKASVFDRGIDNVGNRKDFYENSHLMLKPGGTFVQVGVGEAMSLGGVLSILKKQIWSPGGMDFYFVNMKNSAVFFEEIGKWMSEGRVRPKIYAMNTWDEVPEAFRELRGGRVLGKIVITVSKDL